MTACRGKFPVFVQGISNELADNNDSLAASIGTMPEVYDRPYKNVSETVPWPHGCDDDGPRRFLVQRKHDYYTMGEPLRQEDVVRAASGVYHTVEE